MMTAVIAVSCMFRFKCAQHQVQIANIIQIFKRNLNIPIFRQTDDIFQSFHAKIIYAMPVVRQMNDHRWDIVLITIHYALTISLKNALSLQVIHGQAVLFLHGSVNIFYIKSCIPCQMNIFLISAASAKLVAPP